jgi:hypothetical protein
VRFEAADALGIQLGQGDIVFGRCLVPGTLELGIFQVLTGFLKVLGNRWLE